MERIRPPYRPDDDAPFAGERWGCFWLITQLIGLVVLYFAIIWFLEPDEGWEIWIRYLFLLIESWIIWEHFRKKYRR